MSKWIFTQPHEIIRWHRLIYSNHLSDTFKRVTFTPVASEKLGKKPQTFNCLNYLEFCSCWEIAVPGFLSKKGRQIENKKQSSLWSGVQQWGAGVFCVLFLIYSQKTARQIDDNGKTFPLLQETQRGEKNPTNRKKMRV